MNDNIVSLNLFDNKTGKMCGEFYDIKSANLQYNADILKGNNHISRDLIGYYDGSFCIDVCKLIDINQFLDIVGDLLKVPDKYAIQYTKIVPARKHRKKRINKKWLKRYGVKQIYVNSKGWKLQNHTDGTYELVKQ